MLEILVGLGVCVAFITIIYVLGIIEIRFFNKDKCYEIWNVLERGFSVLEVLGGIIILLFFVGIILYMIGTFFYVIGDSML